MTNLMIDSWIYYFRVVVMRLLFCHKTPSTILHFSLQLREDRIYFLHVLLFYVVSCSMTLQFIIAQQIQSLMYMPKVKCYSMFSKSTAEAVPPRQNSR